MTNPDYRAMCAELADALAEWQLGGGPPEDTADADLIDRARALLAQPEPQPPVAGEVAAALIELRSTVMGLDQMKMYVAAQRVKRAADLLQRQHPQPVAEGPTDDELLRLAREWNSGFESIELQFAADYARAVLAKWGRPTPQPLAAGEVAETANQVKKPKKIQYHYSRHMSPDYADCETVQDAIGMAWADLENGDAWPTKITSDDQVLWTSVALATTESLVKFAKEWGMELPY